MVLNNLWYVFLKLEQKKVQYTLCPTKVVQQRNKKNKSKKY